MDAIATASLIVGVLSLVVGVYPIIRDILHKRGHKEGDTQKKKSPTTSIPAEEKQQCTKVCEDSNVESQGE